MAESELVYVYRTEDELTPKSITQGIDMYFKFVTAGFIFLFQVGFIIFEYGATRPKNADTVLIKTMVIFCVAALATYSLGYAFAYGSTYIIGLATYFSTFIQTEEFGGEPIKWVLLFATNSLTAQMATSGINERAKLISAFVYSIIVTLLIFPLVVGWTLGEGFLSRLGLEDISGCMSIHMVAGFASFFGAVVIKQRLGRFEPLAIKRVSDGDEIYLAH